MKATGTLKEIRLIFEQLNLLVNEPAAGCVRKRKPSVELSPVGREFTSNPATPTAIKEGAARSINLIRFLTSKGFLCEA